MNSVPRAIGVHAFHPINGVPNAVLELDFGSVSECADRLVYIGLLVLNVVRVLGDVGHPGIVHPQIGQDDGAEFFNTPKFSASYIIDFACDEVIRHIRQCWNEVIDVHKNTAVILVDSVRNIVQRPVAKETYYAPIMVIIFPRPVGVKEPQPDNRQPKSLFKIHTLDLVDPFGDGIIVLLNDGGLERNIFREDVFVFVPINLGGTGKDKLETLLALQFQNVSCADHVGLPEGFVVFLSVDAAKFGCQVIHKIVLLLEHTLELAIGSEIGTNVLFVRLMLQIATPDFVSPFSELAHEWGAEGSFVSCD